MYKQAFGISSIARRLGQTLLQWGTRNADDVAKVVTKTVSNAGDELTRVLPRWWKSVGSVAEESAEHATEMVAKHTSKILDDMPSTITKGLRGDIGEEAAQMFASAIEKNNAKVLNLRQTLDTDLLPKYTTLENTIKRHTTQIDELKKLVPQLGDDAVEVAKANNEIFKLTESLVRHEGELRSITDQMRRTQKWLDTGQRLQNHLDTGNYRGVLKELTSVPGKEYAQGVLDSGMMKTIHNVAKTHMMKSPYLNSPRKFLQQYLTYATDPSHAATAKAFAANPHNAKLLAKIKTRHPGMVKKLIEEGLVKAPFKKRLTGLTWGDTAKRLGVGTAALAGGGFGAVKVYDWFGQHLPSMSDGSGKLTATVTTSGEGTAIWNSAQQAVKNLESIYSRTDSALAKKGASQAAGEFVSDVTRELHTISGALDRWDLVVQGSPNKKQAEEAGKNLGVYANEVLSNLNRLRSALGMGAVTQTFDAKPGVGKKSESIIELQAALKLEQTGILDKATVSRLQSMENSLNARKGTKQFTGLFYNPASQQVIPLDYLQSVYKKFM